MDINTGLAFTVETFAIAAAPLYTAVSYVWGLGDASQKIYLNNSEFAVRQNIWSCLHYLFLLRTNSHYRAWWDYIWVDAICINQSDGKEKNEQVRAMDRIFSSAVEVTAWLGLQRLPNWIQWREQAAKTIDSEDWVLSENVFDIAERPYWSRMWIVQELLLAKNIRFHISGASFEFHELAYCVKDKQTSSTENLQRVLAYTKARDLDNLEFRRPLLKILLQFGACQCQDPRDNVFAIMSLISEEDQQALRPYFPDYSLTHDAVVTITISYLRDYCRHEITHQSSEIFDSLGVSPSRLIRRRLIAASKRFDVCSDLELSNRMEFISIRFLEREEELPQSPTQIVQCKALFDNATAKIWWIVTCFGLFQRRRDPYEQAMMDFMAQFEREALLPPRF